VGDHFRKSFRSQMEFVPRGSTRFGPSRIQCTTDEVSRNPIASALGGIIICAAWSFLALCGGRTGPGTSSGCASVRLTHNLRTAYAQLAHTDAAISPHNTLHTRSCATYTQRDVAYARVPIGLLTRELTRNLRATKRCLPTKRANQLQAATVVIKT
jgi:hypothetical protein